VNSWQNSICRFGSMSVAESLAQQALPHQLVNTRQEVLTEYKQELPRLFLIIPSGVEEEIC
jgi:hypothetical protein